MRTGSRPGRQATRCSSGSAAAHVEPRLQGAAGGRADSGDERRKLLIGLCRRPRSTRARCCRRPASADAARRARDPRDRPGASTVTVDAPPGTPADQIPLPGAPAPSRRRPRPAATPRRPPTPTLRRRPSRAAADPAPTPARRGADAGAGRQPRRRRRPRRPTEAAAGRRPSRPTQAPPNSRAARPRQVAHGHGRRSRPRRTRDKAARDEAERDRRRRRRRRRRPTRPSRWRSRAPRRSASRTSSSTSSGSRRSCCRSTRPPASSTACAGRSSRRSTRSRPTTAATSTSPPPGAVGWMQFMPVDLEAVRRRRQPRRQEGPLQPGRRDLRRRALPEGRRRRHRTSASAIFAYNHADWYVDSVLLRARLIGGLPADLVGSLTGLTQGRFPVAAKATYADDLSERDAQARSPRGHNAAVPVEANTSRRGINIYAKAGAPGRSPSGRPHRQARQDQAPRPLHPAAGRLRQHLHLRAPEERRRRYPVPKPQKVTQARVAKELELPKQDAAPTRPPAPARSAAAKAAAKPRHRAEGRRRRPHRAAPPRAVGVAKERAVRQPVPPAARKRRRRAAAASTGERPAAPSYQPATSRRVFGLDAQGRPAQAPAAGLAASSPARSSAASARRSRHVAPHLLFEIRPAGSGAPRIDPKPILDGWKLLESTAIYRAAGKNPFFGPDAKTPSIGQILLMSKEALAAARARRPAHPDLRLRPPRHPGRPDRPPRARHARVPRRLRPQADRHVAGVRPRADDRRRATSPSTRRGNAVDIAAINGIPILGHQGEGSITDIDDPAAADAAGHDEAAPDHLPDDLRRRRQHALAARPRRPHPRRLPPAVRHELQARPSRSTRS